MPTFAEISGQTDGFRAVSQVSREVVTLLWHSSFWDGPLSGMLLFNGERLWFEMVAENDDEDLRGWYRRFAIVRLRPEQLTEEEAWHDLFRANVGWHSDYDMDAPGRCKGLRPQEQWQAFYVPYGQRSPLNLSRNEVVAWFED